MKTKKTNNLKKVGRYDLGGNKVELFLDLSTGSGSFNSFGQDDRPAVIVGTQGGWSQFVEVLVHELAEYALTDIRCRFRPSPDYSQGTDSYTFSCDHRQFSEMAARVGYFLAECLPIASRVFKKYNKKKPRK